MVEYFLSKQQKLINHTQDLVSALFLVFLAYMMAESLKPTCFVYKVI